MHSKLPDIGPSIFSKMSGMAVEYDAINLSQGFPDFPTDPQLIELVATAMREGYNQYAPLAGIYSLREKISEMIFALHGKRYDPETEITITVGASEALFNAITAFVQEGDEVIVIKPAYDVYEPAILVQGAKVVAVQLEPPYTQMNWEAVKNAISSKTRMIIINTPHNPSGMMFSTKDMQTLENLVKDTGILILSDEVYEHIAFDKRQHESASRFPKLAERALITGSFGKTFHVTGWKMGYCLAPAKLIREFQKVHQLNVFCVNHPTQRALAKYLENAENYLHLGQFYQEKRDFFLERVKQSRFKFEPAQGTYFQLMEYSAITEEADEAFAERLIKEYGLASIPVSVFNQNGKDDHLLRFCFAKSNETLEKAAEILNAI
ncbi:methionine aminotransferase [Flavimarina sp. Hel_I_48]|uniref:methionine aminotransferase n=1 Tax=Flavimarina sp. Hel_I_48 TaxID=1392488 RepID=UPI0004DEF108|nr:methionine aminotransferase [Flavimarina sp. Hel_I_48]